MSGEASDTFLRYEANGQSVEVPIERLGICGFGRALTNSVALSDTMASREHAMIRRNATGICILNDLGSTNGTWLNGRPVNKPTQLKGGDQIQIGKQVITFIQPDAPADMADPNAGRTQFLMEEQLVSVLVVDLRGFTPLSAEIGETRIAALMSEINREAGDLLMQAGAWSTKFIGDAVMGLWVHASNTLNRRDIVTVFDVISGYQGIFRMAERTHKPPRPLRFGVGYNAGMASIGNVGASGSADFTAMGEAVNLAFRLETATKAVGCDVLISNDVFKALEDVQFCPTGLVEVDLKGYDETHQALPMTFEGIGPFVSELLAAS